MKRLLVALLLIGIVLVSGCIGGGMTGTSSERPSSTTTSSQSIETSRTVSLSETGTPTGTSSTSSTYGGFLRKDDFSSLDKNFWYVGEWVTNAKAYDKVKIENCVLIIPVNETDRGPYLLSQSIPVKKGEVVIIERKAYAHYGNKYFQGELKLLQTNETKFKPGGNPWFAWMGSQLFSMMYLHYYYEPQPKYMPTEDGFALIGEKWRDEDNYVTAPPVWDEWFTEKIVYDTGSGKVTYYLNGKRIGSVKTSPLTSKYIRIMMHSYGWYTGHYMKVDWIKIEVTGTLSETQTETSTQSPTAETSTTQTAPPQNSLDNVLSMFDIENVKFGELWGVKVHLKANPDYRNIDDWLQIRTYEPAGLPEAYFAFGNYLVRITEGMKNSAEDKESISKYDVTEVYVLPAAPRDFTFGRYDTDTLFMAGNDGKLYFVYNYSWEEKETSKGTIHYWEGKTYVSWDIKAEGVNVLYRDDKTYFSAWSGKNLYIITYTDDQLSNAEEQGLPKVKPEVITLPEEIEAVYSMRDGEGFIIRTQTAIYLYDPSGYYDYGPGKLYTLLKDMPGKLAYQPYIDEMAIYRDGRFYWVGLTSKYDANDKNVPAVEVYISSREIAGVKTFSLMYNTYDIQIAMGFDGKVALYNVSTYEDDNGNRLLNLTLDQSLSVPFTPDYVYGEDECYCHINKHEDYFYAWVGNDYYTLFGPRNKSW